MAKKQPKKSKTKAGTKAAAKRADLEASVRTLRRQLRTTEQKLAKATDRGDRWKTKAKNSNRTRQAQPLPPDQSAAGQLRTAKRPIPGSTGREAAALGLVDPAPQQAATPATVPDSTWTVVQLRAEARDRGLTGMSNKAKAALLDALDASD